MDNILTYLDNLIETFYQKYNTYPSIIILNKNTKDKIFQEIENEINNYDNCWVDKKDTYKGIPLKIEEQEELIKLI